MGAVCVVAVPVSLLLVMGFVPGVFPTSPFTFSQQFPTCPGLGYMTPTVTREPPVLANVSVHWVVMYPSGSLITYQVENFRGVPLFQLGSNGTGSFVSQGGEYVFSGDWAGYYREPANASCTTVGVLVTVAYTLV